MRILDILMHFDSNNLIYWKLDWQLLVIIFK